MIIMFGFIFGDIDLEGEINKWMPAINLVIQAIVSAVYQKIEGDADKAHIGKGTANEEFTTSTEHFE
jgi:hypothetical protein